MTALDDKREWRIMPGGVLTRGDKCTTYNSSTIYKLSNENGGNAIKAKRNHREKARYVNIIMFKVSIVAKWLCGEYKVAIGVGYETEA